MLLIQSLTNQKQELIQKNLKYGILDTNTGNKKQITGATILKNLKTDESNKRPYRYANANSLVSFISPYYFNCQKNTIEVDYDFRNLTDSDGIVKQFLVEKGMYHIIEFTNGFCLYFKLSKPFQYPNESTLYLTLSVADFAEFTVLSSGTKMICMKIYDYTEYSMNVGISYHAMIDSRERMVTIGNISLTKNNTVFNNKRYSPLTMAYIVKQFMLM